MELNKTIQNFKEQQKKMHAFDHVMNLLTYDAATGMPPGASDTLSDTLAVMSGESYRLTVSEEYKAMLKVLNEHKEELDFQTRREAEELLEEQEKLAKVPEEEVVAAAKAQNEANHYWEIAKNKNDYELFKPYLAKLIEIQKRYAGYINPDGDVYDTLLNEFEKGMTQKQMDPFFDDIKEKLVPLIAAVQKSSDKPDTSFLSGTFPIEKQKELSAYVMDLMGIDKERCILRETEHPFTTEFSKNDVRITTKYKEDDLTSNLYSVIHESGHAMYELCVSDDLLHSALGHGATTAIHESQSRLWENYIGRSKAFCQLIFPKVKELFPEQMEGVIAEEFYRAVNVARPSLIRTEADELTYSLHVLIRYEMEKKIFNEGLSVDDLPAEWNRLYKEYLGVDVPDDTQGILQDAHWAGGAFGYFPSYALGTAYSAQIMKYLKEVVDLEKCCFEGDFAPVREWLTDRIYKHGMLLTAEELIENTCHEKFDPNYYTKYLTDKFTRLYRL